MAWLKASFARFMCARTLLRDSELENYWWPYAVSHAVYLLNRRPSSRLPHITPYERLLKVAPLPPMLAWGSVGHWSPPAAHPIQAARHTFSSRGFACHFLGYSGESASTMMILCAGQVFATVDVVFPRLGGLLLTRDSRCGSLNFGAAADLASRSEVFDFAAPPVLPGAVKRNLSQVPLFLADHDRDCGLCTKRKVGRLLLCCSTCSAVAHLKCAGLRRPPASEWHCAPCSLPSAAAARLVAVVAAVPAPAPLAVARAPLLPSVAPALPFPPPLPGGALGVAPAVVPLASSRRPPRLRGSVPAASTAAPVDSVLLGISSPASPLVASVSGTRSSSRLLARSPAVSVVSSRTGELARVPVVACVLAGFAEAGTSRVLPAALVSAVREVQSRASPWLVPHASPALAVPPPGLRSLPSRARAPPRVSTLGGRPLGGKADRARLFSLLARDQAPLMHDDPPMPGLSNCAPLPVLPMLAKDSVNPLTYPLFASQRASRTDPMYDSYAPEAGYDDGRPRLGQGFQHDAKRSAKAGMTWKQALATPHSSSYRAADLRERDVLLNTKSLVAVLRRHAKGPQISFRRVCAFKPHKIGPKQFDSRFCLHGFRQQAGTYDPDRVSTPVCRRDSDRLTVAWGAGRSDVQIQVGDANRAFLQSPLTTHDSDRWVEPPPEWGLPPGWVLQVANSIYGLMQAC